MTGHLFAVPATEPFGVHLMIDGYDADGPMMTDAKALRAFHLVDADVHVQECGLRYPAANLAPASLRAGGL